MECFTVRDGLSGENARFHEASKIIYLHFSCASKSTEVTVIIKMRFINVYLQNVLGKEDSRMD